jgi:large subunit ribosomal protein L1
MGSKKNVDMSMNDTEVKVVETPTTEAEPADKPKVKRTIQKKIRSKKYQAVRAQIDKTRSYDAFSALELVKKLSYSSFVGTITAHLILGEKFLGERADLQFPHSTGKTLKVEIADSKVLKNIEAGKIDFDILLATPDLMPKLAKLAKILGPRGLMPNPKQGTLTAKPEEKKKELESGKITISSERKAPLLHTIIGNTAMETKQLQENLQALLVAFKDKVKGISLAATMSPGVKVKIED